MQFRGGHIKANVRFKENVHDSPILRLEVAGKY